MEKPSSQPQYTEDSARQEKEALGGAVVENETPVSSLAASDDTELSTGIREKALVRKLDRRLLPAVTLLYLLSFLDRSNVGNAKLEGLTTDLHMTGNQYLTGLSLYFIGYVLFEVPCNIVLKRTSPKFWLPTLTLLWGIVATLMGVTQNLAGFFVVRFVLGMTESGLFPGVVFYLSMWYKRNEQHYRVALFFSAASLSGAFGGIFAYGISFMKGVGGLNGWRWIFIIEGLLTVCVAAASYYFIANYPSTAPFLTESERTYVQARLKVDNDATRTEAFSWTNVLKALKDPKCWLYCLAFHTLSLPLYVLSLFLPTIIKELGYSAAQAQLLTVPPYACATISTISVAILSERTRIRAPFIMVSSSVGAIGYLILLASPSRLPGLSYFGIFLAACGIYSSLPIVLAWPANNVSGQTKRATASAMQISIGNIAAAYGVQLYRSTDGPRFYLGHSFAMGYLFANVFVAGFLWWVLKRENARRDRIEGKEGGMGMAVGEEEDWTGDDDLRWRFQT